MALSAAAGLRAETAKTEETPVSKPVSEASARPPSNAEKLGWRLSIQAYSFNRFSFYEAIEKTAALGLRYIEGYPGQRVSKERPTLKFAPGLPDEVLKEAQDKLAAAGVRLVNFGVVGLSATEAQSRAVFEFAKKMGIETIVSEPPPEALDLVAKLCDEYGINVAIHNHPKPSRYWNPQTVLDACKERTKRLGACADTGHWVRSGVDPLQALKQLEGRIVSLHFKDLSARDGKPHDVPWGTGQSDAQGMLRELHRQGLKAVFSIEYEYNWDNSMPEIARCVEFFEKTAGALAAPGAKAAP
jgi:sugar phosphate isomerase/epimerase